MEHKKSLLILDPSSSMRALISRIAEDSGWQAVAVADMPDADVALKAREFQAIATATQLPSVNYLQVLADLRARPGLEFTPIALITGDAPEDYVEAALAAGITEIFSKAQLSQFQIYLAGWDKTAATPEMPQGLRALVLDDEGSVGAYVAGILNGMGLQTTLTQRVDSALSEALESRFDLIVVDLVLKENESGNQFIRLLRASEGLSAQARIIAISGYTDPARRQEALRCGADAFLLKPFSAEEVQYQVERLLPPSNAGAVAPCAERSNRFNLSQRERMICAMVMAGHPDKYIAKQLTISFWTVRAHIGRIFRKCGVGNRVELGNLLRFASPTVATGSPGNPTSGSGAEAQSAVIDWLSLSSHVVDGLQYGILVLDGARSVVYANPLFAEISGYSMNEAMGKQAIEFCGESNAISRIENIRTEIEREGGWSGSLWGTRKGGNTYLARIGIRRMPQGMPMGARYVVEVSDITDQHHSFYEISHHALHDALTGLPNRVLLKNRGELEIHRARRGRHAFAILYLALDHFKFINDSAGHAKGDQALVEVSRRLSAMLRKSDTLARVGSDEFVALVADLSDPQEAEIVAIKLVQALAEPLHIDGKHYAVGISIGISLFPEHAESVDELVKLADHAMYQAKERGGNTLQCHNDTATPRPAIRTKHTGQ